MEELGHSNRHTITLLAGRLRNVTAERDRIEAAYKSRMEECEVLNQQVADLRRELRSSSESHMALAKSKSTLENTLSMVSSFSLYFLLFFTGTFLFLTLHTLWLADERRDRVSDSCGTSGVQVRRVTIFVVYRWTSFDAHYICLSSLLVVDTIKSRPPNSVSYLISRTLK